MSPTLNDDDLAGNVAHVGADEDFILIRVSPKGEVVSLSSLDQDDAVDLLRLTADEIERDGFETKRIVRPS